MLDIEKIKQLYERYLELISQETEEFCVKPTEVRHLIGRLGDFYCAIKTNGSLAHTANQYGFDVISHDGRTISKKNTAQTTGFVAISKRTIDKADDLMVLQCQNRSIKEVYYGPIADAIAVACLYEQSGNYELDILKAEKLFSENFA